MTAGKVRDITLGQFPLGAKFQALPIVRHQNDLGHATVIDEDKSLPIELNAVLVTGRRITHSFSIRRLRLSVNTPTLIIAFDRSCREIAPDQPPSARPRVKNGSNVKHAEVSMRHKGTEDPGGQFNGQSLMRLEAFRQFLGHPW